MSTLQEVKFKVDQLAATAPYTNGNSEQPTISKMGQLYTADWKARLADAGYMFELPLGTTSGDTTATGLTGNAAHDNDQPEIVIAIDSGWLIPVSIEIAIQVNDDDAYDDMTQIGIFVDRSQTVAAGATATVATAINMLDGGSAFSGRCYTTVTSDITNPVGSDVLAFKYWENTQLATETAGTPYADKYYYKSFDYPRRIAGPCSIVGYVIGTNTPVYFGSIVFAHIPASFSTVD